MNREIKFRVFVIKLKQYSYDVTLYANGFVECVLEDGSKLVLKTGEYILQEYIGLKDKNGKEIYEGDVDKNGLYIKYNPIHCAFMLYCKNGVVKDITADLFNKKGKAIKIETCSDIEVIGNIYENPELV